MKRKIGHLKRKIGGIKEICLNVEHNPQRSRPGDCLLPGHQTVTSLTFGCVSEWEQIFTSELQQSNHVGLHCAGTTQH